LKTNSREKEKQMEKSFWRPTLSRRRVLALSGAGSAAALLAACGGGSKTSSGTSGAANQSGLISTPLDTSKQAKRGGVLKWFQANEPAHMDIHIGLAPLNTPNNLVNDNLLNEKAGYLKPAEYS